MMSSLSSMPIERRTTSGPAPAWTFCASLSWRWVVEAGWMISERVSPILARCENSFTLDTQLHAGVVAALQAEREHRARALRAIFAGEVVVAVAGESRIADPRHFRVIGDPFGDGLGVVAMLLHAQRQRLDPGQDQKRIERRDCRADVAQRQHAAGDGEGEIAEGLVQYDAVIFRPRLDSIG